MYPAVAGHHSLFIGFQVELPANLRVARGFSVSPLDLLNPPTTYVFYFSVSRGPSFFSLCLQLWMNLLIHAPTVVFEEFVELVWLWFGLRLVEHFPNDFGFHF